ncbi:MAG: carboxypeptidase-like regulatory domain-containing protein [Janthinobacterium lividum]
MLKYFRWCVFFLLLFGKVYAQENQFQGIVFDQSTKERIARVLVSNNRTKANTFNNLKGEFKIAAQLNDVLIFSKIGYFSDTVKITALQSVLVYLKRSSITLREVTIKDSVLNAQKQLEATKKEFNQIYGSIANKDLLTTGSNGAGIGIDAIYNMLSRRGRNATKLRGIVERDYKANVVDARFNPIIVGAITGLKGEQLTNFMYRYRPDYDLVVLMNEYDFISYIKSCYNRFRRNPSLYLLSPLQPLK